ncbi:GAP family protein [Microbacterium sp. X-17]|uniref:GAP family protein n=1 Tax=Microbacterium sp. X-17 TaxID=3144404 RepID=UPI0031F5BB60
MESVLWYVVPLGVAMAFSILPILAAVILLLSPRPVPVSVAYLSGWTIGVFVLVTLFTLIARLVPAGVSDRMPTWVHIVEMALGALLVLWGLVALLRSRRGDQSATSPSWTRMLNGIQPWRSFGFGLVMNVRPKNLTLVLAAGLAIGTASLPVGSATLAIVIFTIVGISTVGALVLAYLFGDGSVRPLLERLSGWLVSHSSTVLWVSMMFVGLILIVLAIVHLNS